MRKLNENFHIFYFQKRIVSRGSYARKYGVFNLCLKICNYQFCSIHHFLILQIKYWTTGQGWIFIKFWLQKLVSLFKNWLLRMQNKNSYRRIIQILWQIQEPLKQCQNSQLYRISISAEKHFSLFQFTQEINYD